MADEPKKKTATLFMKFLIEEVADDSELDEAALIALGKRFLREQQSMDDDDDEGLMSSDSDDESAKKKKKQKKKAATTTKKKGPKKEKDPNAPKKPLSSYMLFSKASRADVKASCPTMTPSELMKELGSQWRGLEEADKKPYADAYAKDKARYDEEMKTYSAAKPFGARD